MKRSEMLKLIASLRTAGQWDTDEGWAENLLGTIETRGMVPYTTTGHYCYYCGADCNHFWESEDET